MSRRIERKTEGPEAGHGGLLAVDEAGVFRSHDTSDLVLLRELPGVLEDQHLVPGPVLQVLGLNGGRSGVEVVNAGEARGMTRPALTPSLENWLSK